MANKNVLSCLLKDGKEVNAVMLVGRLFHGRATEAECEQLARSGYIKVKWPVEVE